MDVKKKKTSSRSKSFLDCGDQDQDVAVAPTCAPWQQRSVTATPSHRPFLLKFVPSRPPPKVLLQGKIPRQSSHGGGYGPPGRGNKACGLWGKVYKGGCGQHSGVARPVASGGARGGLAPSEIFVPPS